MVDAAPVRDVGKMRRRDVTAAADPGGIKMRGAAAATRAVTATAPAMAAATATATTAPTLASASASARLAGERHIGRANRDAEGADTCGKAQDKKLSHKLFSQWAHERSHDVSFP
jgi:hypothetical protein